MRKTKPAIGALFFFGLASVLALYFTFAAVQGSFGLFNRVQVQAQITELEVRRDHLQTELVELRNKTTRLSDDFLDLDLLDERARDVLGLARPNEVVIR